MSQKTCTFQITFFFMLLGRNIDSRHPLPSYRLITYSIFEEWGARWHSG